MCRNGRHLQIGRYQAHAIGSCVERLALKVDVCIVRVRYPIPTREGSQRASAGRSYCRKDQYWHSSTLRARIGHVLQRIGLWDGCGIGTLLVSPRGATYSFSIRLPTTCTNNLAEYEAVRKGMDFRSRRGEAIKRKRMVSELLLSKPGGHVLSP
jgi:hypothetical protein